MYFIVAILLATPEATPEAPPAAPFLRPTTLECMHLFYHVQLFVVFGVKAQVNL